MNDFLRKILPEKQPKSGGLFLLQKRLRQSSQRRNHRRRLAWGLAGVAALALIWWLGSTQRAPIREPASALLGFSDLGMLEGEQEGSLADGLYKVSESENVIYYKLVRAKSE